MSETEQLRRELRAAIGDRARLIHAVHQELAAHMGKDDAADLLRRATYKVGRAAAVPVLEAFGGRKPTPLEAVRNYERTSPDRGRVFPLRYTCDESGACDVDTLACPLKDVMEEMGLSTAEFQTVARIFDGGTAGLLEGLGFCIATELPVPGGAVCCKIRIAPGPTNATEAR